MRCQDVFFLQELERSANKEVQPCDKVIGTLTCMITSLRGWNGIG